MPPEDDLEKIRQHINMEELVSAHTRLKRSGGMRFSGLCPFHKEKTPSFTVDAERKLWHCFGCSEGGDMFTFVMKTENVEFPEAVQILARRAGVTLTPFRPENPVRTQDRELIQKINALACRYFVKVLNNEKKGAEYRAYLEKRELPPDLVRDYAIGATAAGWDGLIRAFATRNITPPQLIKAGLVVSRDGHTYDRFRERLIFPLRNVVGDIVGFAVRSLGDAMPKYLNTPETMLFDKGKMLYNLDRAKKNVEDNALILTEGYMDVLALVKVGILNAVASMGTALTSHQVDTLRRYGSRAYLCYDSDLAGDAASMRGIEMLVDRGMDIRVITLPQGQDPDDVVRAGGAEAFRERISAATGYFEYFLEKSMARHGADSPAAMRDIILELAPLIRKSQNSLLQDEQMKTLAATLGLDEQRVRSVIGQATAASRKGGAPQDADTTMRVLSGHIVLEKKVIEYLFSDTDSAATILERLNDTDFTDGKLRAFFKYIKKFREETGAFVPDDFLNANHPQNIVTILSGISLIKKTGQGATTDHLASTLDKFEGDVKKRRLVELKKMILEAEKLGDRKTVDRLAAEMTSLKKNLIGK